MIEIHCVVEYFIYTVIYSAQYGKFACAPASNFLSPCTILNFNSYIYIYIYIYNQKLADLKI